MAGQIFGGELAYPLRLPLRFGHMLVCPVQVALEVGEFGHLPGDCRPRRRQRRDQDGCVG